MRVDQPADQTRPDQTRKTEQNRTNRLPIFIFIFVGAAGRGRRRYRRQAGRKEKIKEAGAEEKDEEGDWVS
jgi:hypothetical protein